MRVCTCVTVLYWALAHSSFSGIDDNLFDDHYDALGYDNDLVGWESDSDE